MIPFWLIVSAPLPASLSVTVAVPMVPPAPLRATLPNSGFDRRWIPAIRRPEVRHRQADAREGHADRWLVQVVAVDRQRVGETPCRCRIKAQSDQPGLSIVGGSWFGVLRSTGYDSLLLIMLTM